MRPSNRDVCPWWLLALMALSFAVVAAARYLELQ